ncbi:MAG: major facilitator family transporter [Candidatus Xenolissoclinum pacificiensis L6]|uniref:Major facilitator family transporter n=1 Tax=Candidatus Xenolissoclinum pacificiensis L6 TaxID=1401685 RepID=W2V1T9_9RICK|nr:MAG: major facilitator family transporter [Candidatus Xenolissoclinum pacificiensis L6]
MLVTALPSQTRQAIISSLLCNIFVWYDYALFGTLSTVLIDLFFPQSSSEYVRTLSYMMAFAVGFVARPMGSLFFGYIGDKYNRRIALILSIILMLCPSFLLAILPTYSAFGMFATLLLFCARFTQGFALGGEAGNAVFLIESSPKSMRALVGSLEVLSALIGPIICISTIYVIKKYLSDMQFVTWGWRLAFIVGVLFGILGILSRLYIQENNNHENTHNTEQVDQMHPIYSLFSYFKMNLLIAICIDAIEEVTLYTFLVFFAVKLNTQGEFLYQQSWLLVLLVVATIFFAKITDLTSSYLMLMISALSLLLCALPIFFMIYFGNKFEYMIALIVFILIIATSLAPVSLATALIFPREVRYTGFAFARNISSTIFGGFAPVVLTILEKYTDNPVSPAFFLIFCAIIAIFYLGRYKKVKPYL